jgi:MFS family permease
MPPLRSDRRVLAWLGADTVSNVGDQVWFVALAYTAAGLGDPALAGLVIAAGTVPNALLVLVGGTLVDRWPTRRVIIGASAAKACVMALAAVWALASPPHAAMLIVVAVALGTLDALHDPAAASLPREMVAADRLVALTGLRQLAGRVATLAGPVLGGILVAVLPLSGIMLVDGASFLVVVAAMVILPTRFPRERQPRRRLHREVVEGLRYAWRDSLVRDLVIAFSSLNVFVSPVVAIGLALRVHEQDWGPVALGVLSGFLGAGAIAGTLAAIRWRPQFPLRAALLVLLIQSVGLAVIGLGDLFATGAAMLTVGLTAGLASPLGGGTIQRVVDGSYIGRVSALLRLGDNVLGPLALAAFGALAAGTSVTLASVLFASGMAGVLLFGLSRPLVRNLPRA